ncbi:MSMEG_0565 family glycosyltransferase [Curtobacterium sp. A7_M15]|uniref:MSMEG_0565 family glycosyltransferase n=1 Tax=Curtobacterium sp. A7_M15 TaxID=3065241 RepID=UPI002737A39C|nr:MSMEG_0565 family glycosyltransferase [Curtobacterium sp. A7_M15]MDP4331982.1 MSMEG_0565 family glycosyltransferase [Curtobacterium sp. A7_M15]
MRIALLTYSTKPRGGVVHTLALAEALATMGHDVTVGTLGRSGDRVFFRDVDPRVRLQVVPFPAGPDEETVGERIVRSIAVLRDGLDLDGFDIVHAQDCISSNACEGAVRTVHHLDTFTTEQLIACHDRAVREPAALVCVSKSVAAEVAREYGRVATVIPNGVDAARFARAAGETEDAMAARARWTDRLGRYVLAVGGIEPRKGTIDLLAAYDRLRSAPGTENVRLVLAGGETLFDYRPYRAAFDAMVAERAIPVTELGVVPDPDLPSLMAAAAAFSFVSTKEGFGLAATEALAAGVPVVARDLPVLREVFGPTVRYAADVDDIARGLRSAVGDPVDPAAGRALAARYSWPAAAAAHVALYERLRENAGGSPVGRTRRTSLHV